MTSNTPHGDLDLERQLSSAAARMHVPAGELDAVVARADRRTRVQRRLVATVAAVGVLSGTVGAVSLAGRGGEPADLATDGGVTEGDAGIEWRVQSPSSALGWSSALAGDGPIYAISTAPGTIDRDKPQPSRVIWRSDDGVEWTAVSTNGPDLYVSDLSPRDGRVYAVGTAPGTRGSRGGELVAGWSDDGAKTFSTARLPIDYAAVDAVSKQSWFNGTEVAAGPKGTVAVAVLSANLDVPKVLPDGASAPHGWATTATGVDVLGPRRDDVCPDGYEEPRKEYVDESGRTVVVREGRPVDAQGEAQPDEVGPTWCQKAGADDEGVMVTPQDARGVTASYTWAQLGVDGDELRAVRRHPIAFVAAPGTTDFQRVDLPALDNAAGSMALAATDDGFELLATVVEGTPGGEKPTAVVLRSTDGRTWTRDAGTPAGISWAATVGRLQGRTVVVGDSERGAVVAISDGNGGWVTRDVGDVVDPAVSKGKPVHVAAAGIGPMGIVLVGAPEAEPVRRTSPPALDGPDAYVPPAWRLLVSRDGTTWDDSSLSEVAGREITSVTRVTVTGMQALIAGSERSGDAGKPGKPVVLVGNPT